MDKKHYKLAIIGGGPAGCAAAVYASRKRIKTVIIVEDWGGQSVVSSDVQNWIGTPHISGIDIAKNLKEHIKTYADDVLDIIERDFVLSIEKTSGGFEVKTNKGAYIEVKTVLACSGARRRTLPVEGADRLNHKGISYCASCDAPLFDKKDVVVVGGGNAGFESALQLLEYASSVVLIEREAFFRADPITVQSALKNPLMKAISGAEIKKIEGANFVERVLYSDKNQEEKTLEAQGVFVEIGSIPNSGFLPPDIKKNDLGEAIVDPMTQRTNIEGMWAAGDVSNGLFKQNNISMGDAVKALEDIYFYLNKV